MGADTYIAVSPSKNILFTCDPEAVSQILRGSTFDKPPYLLNMLNVFGPTMTGTSNQESRRYRKITAPFFNEGTMQKIWTDSLDCGGIALKVLLKSQKFGGVEDLRAMLAKLTLYLINSVCFESNRDCTCELEEQSVIPPGHSLSYTEAIHTMLDYFPTVAFIPSLLLGSRINSFPNV